ncbi:MAG: ATP-binding protein [Bacilli bacterium]|nr:ATP-binding protein [Bacilli bacterium]MBO6285005.1 ATP-binding protein [Bacilli bacterium]
MKHIVIPADKKVIAKGIEPIIALLEDHDADFKLLNKIELALDELYTNIASYAYEPGTGDIEIDYDFDEETRLLTIIIADSGKAFDPLAKEDPNIALPAESRQIGGLGIFIVKNVMDETTYCRVDNKNILTLKKKI